MKLDLGSKKVPTIVGIVVLIIGVVAGVLVVVGRDSLSVITQAGPTAVPRQVEITNVDSDTFTVSWVSDTNVNGYVRYGTSAGDLNLTAGDNRDQLSGETGLFTTHYVTVRSLAPSTTYYFELGSGSESYDDAGAPYQVTLPASTTIPDADTISGKVVLPSGQGVPGAIVYVEVPGGMQRSTLTKESGVWTLPLATTRTASLSSYLEYDREADALSIVVQAGDVGTSTATVNTGNDSPVPDLVIGESHNFVTTVADTTTGSDLDEDFSDDVNVGAGFGAIGGTQINEAYEATLSVKLVTPISQGELIATSSPEFSLTGPEGQTVTITVNSEHEQVVELTFDEDGQVEWTPPEGLEPGEHTLEIEYVDDNGILQRIMRSFTVMAAEPVGQGGLPAFTSTPSATLTPTLTPTATPSGSSTPSAMPSTSSGVPDAGVEGLTFAILGTGAAMFFGGGVWQWQLAKRKVNNSR